MKCTTLIFNLRFFFFYSQLWENRQNIPLAVGTVYQFYRQFMRRTRTESSDRWECEEWTYTMTHRIGDLVDLLSIS